MGVFSEIAMEQQNSMFDSSAAFEDDEAFELEEMESLPVPPVGTDAVTVSAASVPAGETASADAEEEPVDEVASDGEEKSAEEGNSAQPPAAEDEEKKRAEHEAAEAQRKAEFDAKQQAKKAAEQEQIARLEAMSDEEVIAASTQRVSTDVEKLTRRNMKECVSEHIQMLCILSLDNVVFHQLFEQACGTLCIAFPGFGNGGSMVFGKIPLHILQYLVIGQLLIGGRCEEYIIQITHRHPPHIHTPHLPLTARPVPSAPEFPVPCSVKQCIWGCSR